MLRKRPRERAEDAPSEDGSELAAAAVLDAAEVALGYRPGFLEGPAPVLAGAGPHIYSVQLETDAAPWTGPLHARLGSRETLEREAAWLRAMEPQDFRTPEIVSDADLARVLVLRAPAGENLAACMANDLLSLPRYLAAFGKLHARLHALPTDGMPDDEPVAPPAALAARASARNTGEAGDALNEELTWLEANQPADRDLAICHAAFNPVHVHIDAADTDTAVPADWTRARLGDPAYDVAATVTGFWSVPYFAENAIQRTGLKAARDSLISAYLKAYNEAAHHAIDADILDYWKAYHHCWLATDIARYLYKGPTDAWDPAASVTQPERTLAVVHRRFRELTKSG